MVTIKTRPAVIINRHNSIEVKYNETAQEDITSYIKKDYIIACVLDEFSYKSFKYEANFIQLDPDNWEETIVREKPHLLLVESAWKGKDLQWRKKIGGLHIVKDNTLRDLVNWCKDHNIPTVFWNKEDPSNFDHFIEAAKYFDFVFTTDFNSITRYKDILGHDRIFVLPFAAQPRLHNPINRNKEKLEKVAFAGTWYNQKHESRRKDLQVLLTPALDYELHIYDRMFENKHKNYLFPEIYQPCIKGFLTYDEMIPTYKKYRVFLNVNSVSESPTMFSRRVFELLACGTSVISSYSLGIEELFPGLVKMCRYEADTRQYLQELLYDEEYRDRLALQAQREVFGKHTYKHRLERMLDSIGFNSQKDVSPGVSIISICSSEDMLNQVMENYLRQNYSHKELIIILPNDEICLRAWKQKNHISQNIITLHLSVNTLTEEELYRALKIAKFPYVSFFNANDYYAPNFLVDLLYAFDYTDAGVVGKCSYYSTIGDTLTINNAKLENQYVDYLWGSAIVVKKELFDRINYNCSSFFEYNCFSETIKLYATDRFNYICKPQSLLENNIEQISI